MKTYEDKQGKIRVDIQPKQNWIFFQREKKKPSEPPIFFGMELSVLKKIIAENSND